MTTPPSDPHAVDRPRSEEAAPTCYRHPGRQTYIRCARCDRPICPDCMRDAPVGFQCPECVRAGTVKTRTPIGGAVARRPDVVTLGLIVITVIAFLLQQNGTAFERQFEEVGATVCGTTQQNAHLCGLAYGEYYRLVSAVFLHVAWWHIAMNMYALWLMGPILERVMGVWRFLGLYLVAGLAGNVLAYAVLDPRQASIGASGAIYGLFAALWVVSRRFGIDTGQITTIIVINLALSFLISGISWQAHLGGLAAGALIAAVYAYTPKTRWRPVAHVGVLVLVTAIAMAGALARTASIT